MTRFFLGAFGDAGHAFPMLALGARLVERGHAVAFQTWKRWEGDVTAAGMEFLAAPEYQVFPTRERPLKPYEAAVRAAEETVEQVRGFGAEAAVSDVLTPAPALAAEMCQVPVATLVPHIFPWSAPGFPAYSIGARKPRTGLGRALWRSVDPMVRRSLEAGRRDYNESRARLGLGPLPEVHTGMSRSLTLVATLPQLEYPRPWPAWTRVVGPLIWEPPGERVSPVDGSDPVVLVAPSTAQDPEHRLLRASLAGLADAPVRVIATWNGREPDPPVAVPANAVLVPWLSYAQTMPSCDLVVSHGGHGTLVRALTLGCPLVLSPAAGDMGENAARADWAGTAVRIPRRFLSPRSVALAVRRALRTPSMRERAREMAEWFASADPAARAGEELEAWIRRGD